MTTHTAEVFWSRAGDQSLIDGRSSRPFHAGADPTPYWGKTHLFTLTAVCWGTHRR